MAKSQSSFKTPISTRYFCILAIITILILQTQTAHSQTTDLPVYAISKETIDPVLNLNGGTNKSKLVISIGLNEESLDFKKSLTLKISPFIHGGGINGYADAVTAYRKCLKTQSFNAFYITNFEINIKELKDTLAARPAYKTLIFEAVIEQSTPPMGQSFFLSYKLHTSEQNIDQIPSEFCSKEKWAAVPITITRNPSPPSKPAEYN
jgi:hypothetical protein